MKKATNCEVCLAVLIARPEEPKLKVYCSFVCSQSGVKYNRCSKSFSKVRR